MFSLKLNGADTIIEIESIVALVCGRTSVRIDLNNDALSLGVTNKLCQISIEQVISIVIEVTQVSASIVGAGWETAAESS